MKIRKIYLTLLAVLPFGALQGGIEKTLNKKWSSPAFERPAETINVLMAHGEASMLLEARGKYKIYDPYLNKHVSTRFTGKRQIIQAITEGLKWGEEFPGLYQIELIPAALDSFFILNGKAYQGSLVIYNIGGSISAVNKLTFDDYISSQIMKHYYKPYALETLSALAIMIRTNALTFLKAPRSKYWAMDGRQEGYQGEFSAKFLNLMQQAISQTRNMVLSFNHENKEDPLILTWDSKENNGYKILNAKITLEQADDMAKKGMHAAEILKEAFPNTSLRLAQ